jgi:hypothetical protein
LHFDAEKAKKIRDLFRRHRVFPWSQGLSSTFTTIKMDSHEQRCAMKFLFLQGKRDKAMNGELHAVLGEAAVSLATVKRWCQRINEGNCSLDDESKRANRMCDFARAISQFLTDEPVLSACIFAKRLATSPHTIKEILARESGMKRFMRRLVRHELISANIVQRVADAQTLVHIPRSDSEKAFAHIMIHDESWF